MASMAEAADIPFRTYVAIDMGETWPRINNLTAIARALGVPVSRLFRDASWQPTPAEALEILRKVVERSSNYSHPSSLTLSSAEDPRISRILDILTRHPNAIPQVLVAVEEIETALNKVLT